MSLDTSTGGDGPDVNRYTLAEARAELARQECGAYGHDIDIISVGGQPKSLICGRGCGHPGWAVTAPVDPARDGSYREKVHDAINRGIYGLAGAPVEDWPRLQAATDAVLAVRADTPAAAQGGS